MTPPNSSPRSRSDAADLFRGLALLIIFINHIPFNELSLYTPSRFGFSDAAEIFIYCSGLVAALALGRCLERVGVWLGTLRVLYRCGQIYVTHLGLFMSLALACVIGNTLFMQPDYIDRLNLRYFFDQTPEALLGLATLTYVPNYFDILPMYLVILLWIPVVWTAAQLHRGFGLLLPIALYTAMWFWGWELPAEPHSDRPWFFNPLAWQLLFFTGFAFGAGWLRIAAGRTELIRLSWAIVLLAIPLSYEPLVSQVEWLRQVRAGVAPLLDKTHFGLLRGAHFLALAYLAYSWCHQHPDFLQRPVTAWIRKAGEHSLPVFFLGMNLSYLGGMVLDQLGNHALALALVNIGGGVLLIVAAHGIAWLATQPWKTRDRAAAGLGWNLHASMAPGIVRPWKAPALQVLSTGMLLLPLSVAPLYLASKHTLLVNASIQVSSDSNSVLDEPDTLQPADSDTEPLPNQEELEFEQSELPATGETVVS